MTVGSFRRWFSWVERRDRRVLPDLNGTELPTDREITGERDLTYNIWHRPPSLDRFLKNSSYFYVADSDLIEYSHGPLFLFTTRGRKDEGQQTPDSPRKFERTVATNLGIPLYLVLYTPCDEGQMLPGTDHLPNRYVDIKQFRVARLWPQRDKTFRTYSPAGYAIWLKAQRETMERFFTSDAELDAHEEVKNLLRARMDRWCETEYGVKPP